MFDLFKANEKMSFHSSYSKKEIFDILEKNVDTSKTRLFIGGGNSSKEILGTVGKEHFKIQKKRKYAQPDIPCLYGTLYEADDGTLIVCHFDSSRSGTILFLVGFILLLIIMLFVCLIDILEGKDMFFNMIYLLVILCLLFSSFLGCIFAKRVNPQEALFLKSFLKNILKAECVGEK